MNKQKDTGDNGKTAQVVTCAERISPDQDSCWSWVVCFAAVVSNVIIAGFTFSYGILFPALLDEFKQGKAKSAWVGSIAMMSIGLYGPLIAKLYHCFGARIVSFCGALICVVGLITASKAPNLYLMYLTYGFLFGIGSSGIFIVTFIVVPRYFIKWRSLSMGLISMGPGGGTFIMSPIVHELFVTFGWRGTFLAMAGIVSITCVLAFVYRPILLESDVKDVGSDSLKEKKFWDISILKHKVFVLITLAGFVYFIGHYTPTVHMVRYLEDRGFPEGNASRLYMYSGLASLIIRPVIGRLNDANWINMLYIYSIAAVLEGVATFIVPFATTNFHFILYFVLLGLTDGVVVCGLCIAVINGLPEKLRPLGFGTYQCLASLASACGPALGGFVADIEGSYLPVFKMVGALIISGAAILFAVSCVKRPEPQSTMGDIAVWEMEALVVVEKCSVV